MCPIHTHRISLFGLLPILISLILICYFAVATTAAALPVVNPPVPMGETETKCYVNGKEVGCDNPVVKGLYQLLKERLGGMMGNLWPSSIMSSSKSTAIHDREGGRDNGVEGDYDYDASGVHIKDKSSAYPNVKKDDEVDTNEKHSTNDDDEFRNHSSNYSF